MIQSNLARNCEEIVEIDRDIVEVCRSWPSARNSRAQ